MQLGQSMKVCDKRQWAVIVSSVMLRTAFQENIKLEIPHLQKIKCLQFF